MENNETKKKRISYADACRKLSEEEVLPFLMRKVAFSDALHLETAVRAWLFDQASEAEMAALYQGSALEVSRVLSRLSARFISRLISRRDMKHKFSRDALQTWLERALAAAVRQARDFDMALEKPEKMGEAFFAGCYGDAEDFRIVSEVMNAENITFLLDSFAAKLFWLIVMGPGVEEFQELIRYGQAGEGFDELIEFIMDYPASLRPVRPLVENAAELVFQQLESDSLDVIRDKLQKLIDEYDDALDSQVQECMDRGLALLEIEAILRGRRKEEAERKLPDEEEIREWFQTCPAVN